MEFHVASPAKTSEYCLANISWRTDFLTCGLHFLRRWPDIAQIDVVTLLILPDRIVRDVDVDSARQCIRQRPAEATRDKLARTIGFTRPSNFPIS